VKYWADLLGLLRVWRVIFKIVAGLTRISYRAGRLEPFSGTGSERANRTAS